MMKPRLNVDLAKYSTYQIAGTENYCVINKEDDEKVYYQRGLYKTIANIPDKEIVRYQPLYFDKAKE